MIHASPFFESVLTGEWAETTRLISHSNHTVSSSESFQSCTSDNIHLTRHPSNGSLSPPSQFLQLGAHSDWLEPEIFHHDGILSHHPPPACSSSVCLHNLPNTSPENFLSHSQALEARNSESILTHHHARASIEPIPTAQLIRITSHSFHPHTPRDFSTSPPTNDEAEQDPSADADASSTTPTVTNLQIQSPPEPVLHQSTLQPRPSDPSISHSPFSRPPTGVTSHLPGRTTPPHNTKRHKIEARIYLKEERDASFQDLLTFVYPHLECVCTWHNASDLMTMSQKFDMPLLKRHVLSFLLSSVAGKPIEAMQIAEEHQLPELYKESSRFLLDNWQGWDHKELEILSSQTLLKLEKRRTWFLERLLKLGLVNSSRDYVCPPSCPDPQHCTKLVDDKWRSAWAASFKFGPPQPSSVYRALRCLEPSLHSPALLLPHTSCQQHALRFFADLFDRMFSQFTPRGGGGVTNASSNSTSAPGTLSTATHNPNSSNLNPNLTHATPAGSEQQPAQTHNSNVASTAINTATSPPVNLGNAHNVGSFSMINSSGSSHVFNSDKTIRKAKYFLHVELFENNDKLKKRFE